MSGLFGGGGPDIPKPPPSIAHESVQAAGDAARRKQRAAKGIASTMLTSSSGATGTANIGTTQLLGR